MGRHLSGGQNLVSKRADQPAGPKGDADATGNEEFEGPATAPSLEKPIEARTSISEVPDSGKEEKATLRPSGSAWPGFNLRSSLRVNRRRERDEISEHAPDDHPETS